MWCPRNGKSGSPENSRFSSPVRPRDGGRPCGPHRPRRSVAAPRRPPCRAPTSPPPSTPTSCTERTSGTRPGNRTRPPTSPTPPAGPDRGGAIGIPIRHRRRGTRPMSRRRPIRPSARQAPRIILRHPRAGGGRTPSTPTTSPSTTQPPRPPTTIGPGGGPGGRRGGLGDTTRMRSFPPLNPSYINLK